MASKTLTKSLLAFSRFLLRRLLHRRNSPSHAAAAAAAAAASQQVKLHQHQHQQQQQYPPQLSTKTLVLDVEGGLLKCVSTFPFFMLVALEAPGGFLRGLLLLLLWPLLCCLGTGAGVRVMAAVSFCGVREGGFRAGRALLPKFLLQEVGAEGFEVMGKGRRRVCVSAMPRVMVEAFLREYLRAEVAVGREMRVFGGFYTGMMEEESTGLEELEEEEEEEGGGGAVVGFGSYSSWSLHHRLFSKCKEIYIVTEAEKRSWQPLPPSKYPKPVIFHDGRIAFLPCPLPCLAMFLWLPLGLTFSVLRVLMFALLPYRLAIPLASFTGLRSRHSPAPSPLGPHHLYVCNHRTLLDPIYISVCLPKPVTAVTYSVSPVSELLSPIPTVRLTRNKEDDRTRMAERLRGGDLIVCPEGTTCREPYLLRFSPLFAELTDYVVPVALDTRVEMFYGTTAGGFKWMDPFYFLMNPKPEYQVRFLERMDTRPMGNSFEVANRVQKEIGRVFGFECTALTRKDKYLMLTGNEG